MVMRFMGSHSLLVFLAYAATFARHSSLSIKESFSSCTPPLLQLQLQYSYSTIKISFFSQQVELCFFFLMKQLNVFWVGFFLTN